MVEETVVIAVTVMALSLVLPWWTCQRRRDGLLDHLWPEMDHQHHASSHVVIVVLEQETVVVRTAVLEDEDELL